MEDSNKRSQIRALEESSPFSDQELGNNNNNNKNNNNNNNTC